METNTSTRHQAASQIDNAFNFIQKLYQESSYLIKEIENELFEHELRFYILKPSGYGIIARTSAGLEPIYQNLWLMRKFAVAFVAESQSDIKPAQTQTEFNPALKIIYIRIILHDKKFKEPQLVYGVLYDIVKIKEDGWIKKFENLMAHFEYNESKLFNKLPLIDYEDSYIKLKGKMNSVNLLDINSSEELAKKVIEPVLKIYSELI